MTEKNSTSHQGASSYYGNSYYIYICNAGIQISNGLRSLKRVWSHYFSKDKSKILKANTRQKETKLRSLQTQQLKTLLNQSSDSFKIDIGEDVPEHYNYCKETSTRKEISQEVQTRSVYSKDIKTILKSRKHFRLALIGFCQSGKTFSTAQASGKLLRKRYFSYVFYCDLKRLKNKHDSKEISLQEFFNQNGYLTPTEYIEFLEKIRNDEKMLIILDGLSCFHVDRETHDHVTFGNSATPEQLLWNIMYGVFFPNAKKIALTRPCNLQWTKTWSSCKSFHLIGINLATQRTIIKERNSDIAREIFNNSVVTSDFWSFCFSPAICKSLAEYCKGKTIDNLTNTVVVWHTFFEYIRLVKSNSTVINIENLAKFAHSQFEEKRLCFDLERLKESELNEDEINLLFVHLIPSQRGVNTNLKAHFLHVLVQEFLTALYVLFFYEFENFKVFFENAIKGDTNGRFNMVVNFLFGLCNTDFKTILEKDTKKHFEDFERRRNLLQDQTKNKFKNFKLQEKLVDLCFFGFLNEMKDDQFTRECAEYVTDFGMYPSDNHAAVNYVRNCVKTMQN